MLSFGSEATLFTHGLLRCQRGGLCRFESEMGIDVSVLFDLPDGSKSVGAAAPARPDAVTVSAEGRLEAGMSEVTFRGGWWDALLRLDDGSVLKASLEHRLVEMEVRRGVDPAGIVFPPRTTALR